MPDPQPPKKVAFGNIAHGMVAVGNVVSGLVAVGNVARGFIAIGNVAVGFIAIGNVSVGVIAIGATNAVGLVAGSFLNVVPCILSIGGMNVVPPVSLGFFAPLALGGLSYVFPGARAKVEAFPVSPIARLLSAGGEHEGWVRAQLVEVADARVHLKDEQGVLRRIEADPDTLKSARELFAHGPIDVHASLTMRPAETGTGYRDGVPSARLIECRALKAAPPPLVPWASARELQWWLARGFRVSAAIGLIYWLVRLIID